jgi:outer membrane receptor for ferrienterochelin and colicins
LIYAGDFGDEGENEIRSRTDLLEWVNYFIIKRDFNALVGGSVLKRTGSFLNTTEDLYEVPRYDAYDYTAFTQFDYRPHERLKLVAGGQAIKIPAVDPHLVGRLGALWTISPRFGAKFLYSQAFRRPSAMETDRIRLDDGELVREGNVRLLPEEIDTTDFQLLYLDKLFNGALTLFYGRQKNLIREPEEEDLIQNLASLKARGIELEIEKTVAERFALSAAVTYQESYDEGGNRSIMPVPNTLAKLGIIYHAPFRLRIGLHDSYFSAARPVRDLVPDVLEVNPDADAFHNLTLHVSYQPSDTLMFEVYGTNLLDAGIHYPEYTGQSVNTIPGRPGRAVFIGVGMQM